MEKLHDQTWNQVKLSQAGGIASANKISEETSNETEDKKLLICLFTAMCHERIELEMIYDFETLRKKFEKTHPNQR